jgi:hypothetical protein
LLTVYSELSNLRERNIVIPLKKKRERKRDYKEIHKYQAQLRSARKTMHSSTDPNYIARRKEMTDRITRRPVKAMDHQKLKQETPTRMSSEAVNEKRFHIDCQQTQGEPILGLR